MNTILGFLLVVAVSLAACNAPSNKDLTLIREIREQSNAAIAAHDTASLGKSLTADYNVVTSRNAVSADRRELLVRLAADWAVKPDLVYRRTPATIEVFPAWRMAGENGRWVGTWTEPNGEKITLSGSYYAKWHNVDGRWLIRAEIFTPLECQGGSYCEHGPLK